MSGNSSPPTRPATGPLPLLACLVPRPAPAALRALHAEKLPAYGGAMELSGLKEISPEAAGVSCHTEQQVGSS